VQQGEPFGDECLIHVKEMTMQREVELEVNCINVKNCLRKSLTVETALRIWNHVIRDPEVFKETKKKQF
jgi:hypothetical protein